MSFLGGFAPGNGGGGGGGADSASVTALREARRPIVGVTSAAASASLPNGDVYIPLTSAMDGSFLPGITGTIALGFRYAMSAANAGTLDIELDVLFVEPGDAPDPDLETATPDALELTPGNDTDEHEAEWEFAVTATQRVRFQAQDVGTGTHTGDVRVLGWYWYEVVA